MKGLLIIYCCLAAVTAVVLLAAVFVGKLHAGRRARRDKELAHQYLRIVIQMLMDDDGEVPFFPVLYRCGGRLVLAETLARIAVSTYGLDPEPLRRIAEATGLQQYLLRRVQRTRGYRRAWFLSLLSHLPMDSDVDSKVAIYARDRNRSVRFYALMVQLAAHPETSLRLMASHTDPFSASELAEIMAMIRRGVLPVSYDVLIESSDRNLKSVGLCVVRQFCIEAAENALLRIVIDEKMPELGREALYTLCAMRRPLRRREVARRVVFMSLAERKSLLRYMASEGYSEASLEGVFDKMETPYFKALVNSYKRSLVCL